MTVNSQMRTALGLMSGTSMDGIDAAILRTDGETALEAGPALFRPYGPQLRALVADMLPLARGLKAPRPLTGSLAELERTITDAQAEVVAELLAEAGMGPDEIDVIGFHGQTVAHRPDKGWTLQLGDGARLAAATGIDVVNDFRSADMEAGGQGAPFAPLYHVALAHSVPERPLGVLNLGGVGNVTWIGGGIGEGTGEGDPPLAFDTGPANALIDEWMLKHTGDPCDRDGALAAAGTVDEAVLARLMDNPYFAVTPPKSLDRLDFTGEAAAGLNAADGAATLTAFTAESIVRACEHMKTPPARWIVCGGGRHNPVLMAMLAEKLGVPVDPAEAAGWRGDTLEAEAFAYLAVRSLDGKPLSVPTTTGARTAVTGGRFHAANGARAKSA